MNDQPHILNVREVAALFRVNPKTVSRWAKRGLIPTAFRTPGGHRRFLHTDVQAVMGANLGEERGR